MRNERRIFGKYQVLARLGKGGMGDVYLALHAGAAGIQKVVVIKQLRDDLASAAIARAMFLDEARIATRLNHPNIVQTNEVVDEDDDLYLVMEFLDGQPLSRMLEPKHSPGFSLPSKLGVLVGALEGLHYAHELKDYDGTPLNVVHRDVSPQNIIVTYDGHVKLVDFGVAKAANAKEVTESGVFKGKVRYAAPEQALCLPVDRRTDLFALGTVLWEILCGRRLWQEQADASVLAALAVGQIPRLRDALPNVDPALEAICTKALASDAAARYATALELRDDLLAYLRDHDAGDLAVAVSREFDADRRYIHGVIDTQVKALRDASAGAPTMRHIPLLGPESGNSALSSERSLARGGLSVESESRGRAPEPPRRVRASWVVLAALGILAVFAAIAFGPSHRLASSPPTTSPAAPPVASIHLSLRATPPAARFTLDGVVLGSSPYEGDVPRDEGPHHLSVTADGFERRDLDARFTRDVSVDVALAASAPSAAPPAPPAPPAPTSAAPTAPPASARPAQGLPMAPKSAPKRRIDEDDPYAK